MTLFYIVRHGETEYNRSGRYQGQTDIPLSPDGRQQIRALVPRLSRLPLDVIYTSDLSRALETARIFARGRMIIQDPRLREVNVGLVAGLSPSEIAAAYPEAWAAMQQDPAGARFPEGESAVEVQDRVMKALADIHRRFPDGNVAVVTHGGVVKTIAAAVLELPLERRSRIVLDNCSLTVVKWGQNGLQLVSLNDTGHLPQAPTPVKADF
ncbi:MAG: histidine phosphatase family protein [Mycobacterium leprae]